MEAYEIMREWDREAGIEPRSDEELEADVPGSLSANVFDGSYEDWLEALADEHHEQHLQAILEGRQMWGLPPFV